eukprot:CAMPEP_0185749580 /NCGR_PEP_ID=MMETSP1174-20130828/8275_1 /TAXON_ID=35687 /ORGANISM="Dictyocha speculum, Strain CCMP1381" /LENGTH=72 /DNA_ID=CAMNT_0028425743 /DNA_START=23 /DNA_END=241 /DNA_ORIENTATION=+
MSSATTFWRIAGMSYIQMGSVATSTVRNALKEPVKTSAMLREVVSYNRCTFGEGIQSAKLPITSFAESVAAK